MLFALLLALPQDLVADLNPTPIESVVSSDPEQLTDAGARLFLFAQDPDPTGLRLLWSTPDLAASPTPVPDTSGGLYVSANSTSWMRPALSGVVLQSFSLLGNSLWYSSQDAPGLVYLAPTSTPTLNSTALPLGEFNGRYYVEREVDGAILATDGTAAGTQVVLGDPAEYSQFASLALLGGEAFSRAKRPDGSVALLRLDAHLDSWTVIAELGNPGNEQLSELAVLGGRLWFSARDGSGTELWSSDGTPAGTGRFADLEPGSGSSSPRQLLSDGTRLWFSAATTAHGRELWTGDGTLPGTSLVADLQAGPASSDPLDFEPFPGGLALSALVSNFGREPLLTDGTATGGTLVGPNLVPGQNPDLPVDWTAIAGGLLLRIGEAFTEQVFEVDPAGSAVRVRPPTSVGGGFESALEIGRFGDTGLVSAYAQTTGNELFRTTSIPGTTELVADLVGNVQSGGTLLSVFGRVGDRVVVRGIPSTPTGQQLVAWSPDSSEVDVLADQDDFPSSAALVGVAEFDDRLLFSQSGTLYSTTGLPGSAEGLFTSGDPQAVRYLGPAVRFGQELVFVGERDSERALYRTDGTAAGTTALPGTPELLPEFGAVDLAADGSQLIALIEREFPIQSLVRVDLEFENVEPLIDLVEPAPSLLFQPIQLLGALGDAAILVIEGQVSSVSDPTAGLVDLGQTFDGLVLDSVRVDDRLVWIQRPFGGGLTQSEFLDTPFSCDGTPGSLQQLLDPTPADGWIARADLVAQDGGLAFLARRRTGQSGLWRSDGTLAGTQLVFSHPEENLEGLFPAGTTAAGDSLLLLSTSLDRGRELASFDDVAGFRELPELLPGPLSSVNFFTLGAGAQRVGDALVFNGFTPQTGGALYRIDWLDTGIGVAEPLGTGCAGASGMVPQLSATSPPSVTTPFDIAVEQAPPAAPVVLTRSTDFAIQELDFCTLYLDAPQVLGVAVADAVGSATFAFDLSPIPALAGLPLWTQALVVDPGAGWLGLGGLTPALELVVGP